MMKRPQQQRLSATTAAADAASGPTGQAGVLAVLASDASVSVQPRNVRQQTVTRARSLQDHDPGHHQLIVEEENNPTIRAHVWRPARCEKETVFDSQMTWVGRPIG
jgi:hypothetical protein